MHRHCTKQLVTVGIFLGIFIKDWLCIPNFYSAIFFFWEEKKINMSEILLAHKLFSPKLPVANLSPSGCTSME